MNGLKNLFFDKIELLALLFFIMGIFLLDVNLNMIAVFGGDVKAPVFNGNLVSSMSMFWFGFLVTSFSFLLFSIRSLYKRKVFKKFDLFFAIIGIIGLAIIFAGGLLIFAGGDNLVIPFFSHNIARIDFYHLGIVLEFITILYFSLTK